MKAPELVHSGSGAVSFSNDLPPKLPWPLDVLSLENFSLEKRSQEEVIHHRS